MIIKEKRWLSRFVAMLCVLTMVVGVLTPASVGVAAESNVERIYIEIVDGLTYLSSDSIDMTSKEELVDNGEYKFGISKTKIGYIEIAPSVDDKFNTTDLISFYIEGTSTAPSIKKIAGTKITVNSDGNNSWLVEIKIYPSAAGDVCINPTVQYSVTYSESTDYKITDKNGNKVLSGLTEMYDSDSPVEFKVTATESDKKDVVVSINGNQEGPDQDGIYKIQELKSNTRVVAGVKDKQWNITVKDDKTQGYVCSAVNGANVAYGTDYSFYVAPKAGYGTPTVYVYKTGDRKADNNKIELVGNNYTISGITENKTIEIVSGEVEMCDVIFTEGTGYSVTCDSAKDGVAKVGYGQKLEFSVTLDTGYKMQRVTVNGSVLDGKEENDKKYKYTTKEITGNSTIEVTVKKEKYTVDFSNEASNECELIKGSEKTEYEHGDTCTFYVIPKDGYKVPIVKVNSVELKPVNGTQYETIVTGPTDIGITSRGKIQYDITYSTGEGYSFSYESDTVESGGTLEFTLKVEKDYNNSKPVVLVGGKKQDPVNPSPTADPDEGFKEYKYTVENITSAQIVSVSGIQKNTYNVTLTRNKGYTITTNNTIPVTANDPFNFNVSINEGYKSGEEGIKVSYSVDGSEKFLNDVNGYGDYTIDHITGDTTIKVNGITAIEPTITVEASNATVKKALSDQDISGTTINYDGSLEFTADANEYYQVTQVAVNGQKIEAIDGIYTINGIKDDVRIKVVTRANVLTVNYVDEKYNKSKTVRYSVDYTGNGDDNVEKATGTVTLMKSLATSELYKPDGWLDDTGAEKSSLTIDKEKDNEVKLTAKWVLDIDKIKENIILTTDASWGNGEGEYQYTIRFRTYFNKDRESDSNRGLDEEYLKNIKITGVGTLYSNINIDAESESTDKYETQIKNRHTSSSEPANDLLKQNISGFKGQVIYSFYKDYSSENAKDATSLTNGDYISLRLGSNVKNIQRFGLGWVELTINGEKVILFSKNAAELK